MDVFHLYDENDEEMEQLSVNSFPEFSLRDIIGHNMDDFSKDVFISKYIQNKYFKIKHTNLPNGSIMISVLDVSK